MNGTVWERRMQPETCFQWLQLRQLTPKRMNMPTVVMNSLRKTMNGVFSEGFETYYWFECKYRLARFREIMTTAPITLNLQNDIHEIATGRPDNGDTREFMKQFIDGGLLLIMNDLLIWIYRLRNYNVPSRTEIHRACLAAIFKSLSYEEPTFDLSNDNLHDNEAEFNPSTQQRLELKMLIHTIIRTGFGENMDNEISMSGLQCLAMIREIDASLVSQSALVRAFELAGMEFTMDRFYKGLTYAIECDNILLLEFFVALPDLLIAAVDVATCLTRSLIYCLSLPKLFSLSYHREITVMGIDDKLSRALQVIQFIWFNICRIRFAEPIETIVSHFIKGGLSRLLTLFTSQMARVEQDDIKLFRRTIDNFRSIMEYAWFFRISQLEFYSDADIREMLEMCRNENAHEFAREDMEAMEERLRERESVQQSNSPSMDRTLSSSNVDIPYENVPLPDENAKGAILNLLAFSYTQTVETNASTLTVFKFFEVAAEDALKRYPENRFLQQYDCKPKNILNSVPENTESETEEES